MNPYLVEGPAVLMVSGGRTSGYLFAKVVKAHGGKLPADVIPIFANTGKEDKKTLVFVRDCSERIAPITWLEYAGKDSDGKKLHRVVDFDSASREGEPFWLVMQDRGMTPNTMTRFCSSELKVRTVHRYLRSIGWTEWTSCVGLRADEPRRVSKMRGNPSPETKNEVVVLPLANAGVGKRDVLAWWASQGWGLDLPIAPDGDTWHGNCDLCFLKSHGKKRSLVKQEPQRAIWWAKAEETFGSRFRIDQPSYADMQKMAEQPEFSFDGADLIDCACTD